MINSHAEALLKKQELEMLIKTLDEAVEHGSTSIGRIQEEIDDKQSEIAEYERKIDEEGTHGNTDSVCVKGIQSFQSRAYGESRCYEPDTMLNIAEPAVSNLFLVNLPIDEIKHEDINKLSIYWGDKSLSVEVREPIERDILTPIIEYMEKSQDRDDIKVAIIDRGGNTIYTRTFSNVRLEEINESDYDYSKATPHVFNLFFTFKGQKIERNNILDAD